MAGHLGDAFLNALLLETGSEAKIGIECWIGYFNADSTPLGLWRQDARRATQASKQKFGGTKSTTDETPPAKPQKLVHVNGTGFVISADGYVVTNNHVIRMR